MFLILTRSPLPFSPDLAFIRQAVRMKAGGNLNSHDYIRYFDMAADSLGNQIIAYTDKNDGDNIHVEYIAGTDSLYDLGGSGFIRGGSLSWQSVPDSFERYGRQALFPPMQEN